MFISTAPWRSEEHVNSATAQRLFWRRVVSRPTPDRAIIDAGSKSLTSDLLGLVGYGVVHDLNLARVYRCQ